MKKTLMQFAAMAMAFGAMKPSDRPLMTSDEKERMLNAARQYVCGICSHFPKGNKTFCKTAGHSVTRYTNCLRCKHFESDYLK